jgi:hypothetical protein
MKTPTQNITSQFTDGKFPTGILRGIKTRQFSLFSISSFSFNSNYSNPISPLKILIAPFLQIQSPHTTY